MIRHWNVYHKSGLWGWQCYTLEDALNHMNENMIWEEVQ